MTHAHMTIVDLCSGGAAGWCLAARRLGIGLPVGFELDRAAAGLPTRTEIARQIGNAIPVRHFAAACLAEVTGIPAHPRLPAPRSRT